MRRMRKHPIKMPIIAGRKFHFPSPLSYENEGRIKLQTEAAIIIPAENPVMTAEIFLLMFDLKTYTSDDPIVVRIKGKQMPRQTYKLLLIFSPYVTWHIATTIVYSIKMFSVNQ